MKKKIERPERDKDKDFIYQKWSQLSLTERGKYIASYYGVAIAVTIFAVIVCIFLIKDICKAKIEDVFYVMVVDRELSEDITETIEHQLGEALGIDSEMQQCRMEVGYSSNMNMQSEATITTYMRSGKVDMVIAPENVFNKYAATGYLSPLKECGLEELEENYEIEDLFYAESIDYSKGGAITDLPYHPHEVTDDSECYGIYLRDQLFDGYVAGVMVNCPNQERVHKSMEYFRQGALRVEADER